MKQQANLIFIGYVEKVEGNIARIKLRSEFCEGLDKLDSFSHIIVLGWFHLKDTPKDRQTLRVIPKRHPGAPEVGVFASRSPSRPNPLGLCVVELLGIEGCTLVVKGLDFVEETPIVDIKPYLPRADCVVGAKAPEWTSVGPPT
jgi:tRNA-Thr(GGU) m(6)t(6)A37 methyltransferase TsaA